MQWDARKGIGIFALLAAVAMGGCAGQQRAHDGHGKHADGKKVCDKSGKDCKKCEKSKKDCDKCDKGTCKHHKKKHAKHHECHHGKHCDGVEHAVAVIRPTKGHDVHGVVHFMEAREGVQVKANIHGLEPNGKQAIHVHTYGDVTAKDGTSAGGHFNPFDTKHGKPSDKKRHVGDLGNLEANKKGKARHHRVDRMIDLDCSRDGILGRAVVIHAGKDKFTQPTGGAGARAGVGVIGIAKPKK